MDIHAVEIVKGPPLVDGAELRQKIRNYLAGTDVEKAILFGSFARGRADMASDVDLLLITETSRPFLERGLDHLPLFALGVGVDLIVYTPAEYKRLLREGNPLARRIEKEGEVLYARSTQ